MVKLSSIIIFLLVGGLFAISFINAGIYIANANQGHSIGESDAIKNYAQRVNDSLISYQDTVKDAENSTASSPIASLNTNPFLETVKQAWVTLTGVPVIIFDLTLELVNTNILGGSFVIVGGVLTAILLLLIIFAVVRWVTQGEG